MNAPILEPDPYADDGAELIQQLQRKAGARCHSCSKPLCLHLLLMSLAMGAAETPRCLKCMSNILEQSADDLADQLYAYCQARTCYAGAWKYASEREGRGETGVPSCVLEGRHGEQG